MNRTADQEVIGGLSGPQPATWITLMILAAMALYPLAAFDVFGESTLALYGSSIAAYGLAIILFFGIPTLVFFDRWLLVRVGCIGALLLGLSLADQANRMDMIVRWGMISLTGIFCGWMTYSGKRAIRTYVIGLLFILVLTIIEFGPKWHDMMQAIAQIGSDHVKDIETTMTMGGSSAATVARYTEAWQEIVNIVVRLLPASTILNPIMQFTVGFLWFSGVTVRGVNGDSGVRPFAEWRSPFGLAIPLVAALLARLTGGEAAKLIADNCLMILALFYCVTGLALMEHGFRRMGLPKGMRFAAYLLLFLLQIAGFFLTALLGFIDSFVDWRARAAAKNTVDN
ncbi:hypothetical protein C3F09_05610 [candidate division GN15 bacterium]|uniref:DUF2232 domain-containing protein n=1 Tax=candidate division GN15 bacterium TaxID=2072418 RepID=A0A855X7N8_9BACT|nr:MAG: hypothetical protein C3F09_05610 [candidate division GN15 bacterium]